jgi:hypothetical protein
MFQCWQQELDKVNIKIKIIITENSFRQNHNIDLTYDKFIFEPMYTSNYVNIFNGNQKDKLMSINYKDIVENYKYDLYETKNKHLGLPLYWNNCVRRKDMPFLFVYNFTLENVKELFIILVSKIIMRVNCHKPNEIDKYNVININA